MPDEPRDTHQAPARHDSQHEGALVNHAFPHWGRDALDHGHAIFAIVSHLQGLKLEAWASRVVHWLSFYDGIERYVDYEHDPCVSVRDLLASYLLNLRPLGGFNPPFDLRSAIIRDLVKLEFLRYRAYWGKGLIHDADARIWSPFKQTWLSFLDQGKPDEHLMVFMTDETIPPLKFHVEYLAGNEP